MLQNPFYSKLNAIFVTHYYCNAVIIFIIAATDMNQYNKNFKQKILRNIFWIYLHFIINEALTILCLLFISGVPKLWIIHYYIAECNNAMNLMKKNERLWINSDNSLILNMDVIQFISAACVYSITQDCEKSFKKKLKLK